MLRAVDGMVWEVALPAHVLDQLRAHHLVSRVTRTADGIRARVLAPTVPMAGAVPVRPDLEDAYLHAVHVPADRQGSPVRGAVG